MASTKDSDLEAGVLLGGDEGNSFFETVVRVEVSWKLISYPAD